MFLSNSAIAAVNVSNTQIAKCMHLMKYKCSFVMTPLMHWTSGASGALRNLYRYTDSDLICIMQLTPNAGAFCPALQTSASVKSCI